MALESVRNPVSDIDEVTVSVSQADMVEYNQCQATLKTLYELGIPGKVEEFTAYRILMLLHGRNKSGASFRSLAYPCYVDSSSSTLFRIKLVRRSTNAWTENGSGRPPCFACTTSVVDGKLSCTV